MITVASIQNLQLRIARQGDHQAYKELYTSLYGYLFQFAKTFVKSRETAEEIVSDVFIKVWEKRKELEKIDNLKVYLYVSTRNIAYNYLEKQKRNVLNHLDDYDADMTSVNVDPEQLLITAEMMKMIQKAIEELPPKCKLIFRLVKEDGLKYREVAEVLSISAKTVENQLAIALHKLGNAVSFDIQKTVSSSVRHPRT